MEILNLLRQAEAKKASDLHLIVSCSPLLRIDGALQPMDGISKLTSGDISQVFSQITTPQQREIFSRDLELDFAYSMPGGGHLRCNACQQQGSISLAFRLLPPTIPTLDELGLPQICRDLITKPRGLIVVTGPTGSGKTTTLAAMIQYLNNTEQCYIVTIEDPVEYVHTNNKCAVSQRELAADTLSFAAALKHVLRQDPDVILVGEMRDLETAAAVLTVAETGHLILSTAVLIVVLCQVLVPRINGGRVAAVEIMLANPAVKNLIRDGKTHLLPNTIRTNSQSGMQTLDDALVALYHKGVIERATLLAYCQDTEEVEKLIGGNRAR
ncbi:MAG: ATPase, T2SS/T4P/T4SS family [Chloroflexi bacterium]|nr:ATPase, T2SS/T4P/T4SS family [Chloroflexota bacterium]